jgi:hypothetical protein
MGLTACGPGGVTLGHDWAGSKNFVLVSDSRLTTVAGIDEAKGSSQALAAIPTQPDDDGTLAPHLVHSVDSGWLITVPRKGDGGSRLYRIGAKDHSLDVLGHVEGTGALILTKSLAADVIDGRGSSAALLVYQPRGWKVTRQVQLPGGNPLLSGSATDDTVCAVTESGRVSAVSLTTGRASSAVRVSGPSPTALACPEGRPVVARGSGSPGRKGLSFTVRRQGDTTILTASRGRVDQVEASTAKGEAVVALAVAGGTRLVGVDLATGQINHQVRLPGLSGVASLEPSTATSGTWIVADEDRVAVANLSTGYERGFRLPGQLLSTS